jgi:predicted DNA binding CopG/RHH family protein
MKTAKIKESGKQTVLSELKKEGWTAREELMTDELVKAAQSHVESRQKRDRQVNLRWDDWMIEAATRRAREEGLPGYQTLVYSVMYKFLTGRLVDSGLVDLFAKEIKHESHGKQKRKKAV